MVVMINEQAYHIAIPEGVDPQSFASSTLVKVSRNASYTLNMVT